MVVLHNGLHISQCFYANVATTFSLILCTNGLVCDRLQKQSPQLLLFPEALEERSEQKEILGAMDTLRLRYGHDVIGVGRQYRTFEPAVLTRQFGN